MAQQTENIVISRAVDDFMKEARSFRTKQYFLSKMAEFYKRFQPSNANLERSPSQSSIKHTNSRIYPLPNPFVQNYDRKNAFKNQERKNYHQQYQQLPVHSRTDMDFFKPQQQYEPEPRQMEYDRFGRTTSSQNIVGRPFVDPELQELLNQQYQNNMRMQREQQGGYTGRYYDSNEFLRHYEEYPDYIKYYRKQTPPSPSPKTPNHYGVNQYSTGAATGAPRDNPFMRR